MSLHHHPSESVLTAYASGALADGPSLAAAAHLETCPACRRAVGLLEAVGGALIEDLPQSQLDPQALDLALARIERPFRPEPAVPPAPLGPNGSLLPHALARRKIGARRWVARGLWVAQVQSKAPDGWRTYLLRARPGTRIPQHGHNGLEVTAVLSGAFIDETGRYGPGDFAEADEDFDHRPQVDAASSCLCLISAKGGMRAGGWVRLLQPVLRV